MLCRNNPVKHFARQPGANFSFCRESDLNKVETLTFEMLDTRLVGLSHLLQQQQQQQQQHQQLGQQHHPNTSSSFLPTIQHHHQQQQQQMDFLPRFAHLAAIRSQLSSPAAVSFAQQQLATAEWIKSQLAAKPASSAPAEYLDPFQSHLLNNFTEKLFDPKFPRHGPNFVTAQPASMSPPLKSFEKDSKSESFTSDHLRETSVTHSEGEYSFLPMSKN